jgi:hypothetical protein
MPTDETPDAVDKERRLRAEEEETKEQVPHERDPGARSGDPFEEDDESKPAPPGPEAQQPRG